MGTLTISICSDAVYFVVSCSVNVENFICVVIASSLELLVFSRGRITFSPLCEGPQLENLTSI